MNTASETQATRIAKLKTKPWDSPGFKLPTEIPSVPGMLSNQEKRMLYYLARHDYSGAGVIADMGSFLGGSTICFAAALGERAFQKPVIHSYDLFILGPSEQKRYFPENPPPDLKTRAIFDQHLQKYLHLINVHEGDVLNFRAIGQPIELLFIDIAKTYRVMDHLLDHFFPALIPGQSLVIVQDYLWGTTGPWHHVVMEKLSDYCEYELDTDINSAVFLFKREIPPEVLAQCHWLKIPMPEKLELIERAIARQDTEPKKEFLRANRGLLLRGEDLTYAMHYHTLGSHSAPA